MKVYVTQSAAEARAVAGELIPFRAPHYSVTLPQFVSEVWRSRGGVLYLDTAANFGAEVLPYLDIAIRTGEPLPRAVCIDGRNPWDAGVPHDHDDQRSHPQYARRLRYVIATILAAADQEKALTPRQSASEVVA